MKYRRCFKGLAILIVFCLLVGLPGNAFAFIGADNQPPQLNRAKIVGTLLTLEFNELLKAIPERNPGLFIIMVNGTAQAQPESAVVVLKNLVINLADTVNPGDHVTISYQSGNNGIEDFAGNQAQAFDDYLVENLTPDLIPPLLEDAVIDGANLSLVYNEMLDENSVPNVQNYSILINGNNLIHPSAINVTAKNVILQLPYTAEPDDNVKISYAALNNPIRDLNCNPALPIVLKPVVNNTIPEIQAPVIVSACANAQTITLTYSRQLQEEPLPDLTSFVITVTGQEPFNPVQVSINGNQVVLSME